MLVRTQEDQEDQQRNKTWRSGGREGTGAAEDQEDPKTKKAAGAAVSFLVGNVLTSSLSEQVQSFWFGEIQI